MLRSGKASVEFERSIDLGAEDIVVKDHITIKGNTQFERLQLGDEFFVRYVPQSRYFQSQELDSEGYVLNEEELRRLNDERKINIKRSFSLR